MLQRRAARTAGGKDPAFFLADEYTYDTVTRTPRGHGASQYMLHNCEAAVRFYTESDVIQLGIVATAGSSEPLGVWVNGTWYASVAPVLVNGVVHDVDLTLPAGDKTVEIRESTSLYSTPRDGVFLRHVRNAFAAPAVPTVLRRLVIYGDSIVVGYGASVRVRLGVAALVRADFPGRVTLEAYVSRFLHDDAADLGALAAQLVACAADGATRGIWIEIGTNDWSTAVSTLAVFKARYGALLDAIHALDTTVTIYCQSPGPRSNQATPNANGDTLAAYRTGIFDTVATRPWATYVDGLTMFSVVNTTDGVHPNDTGNAEYKANLKTAVGY